MSRSGQNSNAGIPGGWKPPQESPWGPKKPEPEKQEDDESELMLRPKDLIFAIKVLLAMSEYAHDGECPSFPTFDAGKIKKIFDRFDFDSENGPFAPYEVEFEWLKELRTRLEQDTKFLDQPLINVYDYLDFTKFEAVYTVPEVLLAVQEGSLGGRERGIVPQDVLKLDLQY